MRYRTLSFTCVILLAVGCGVSTITQNEAGGGIGGGGSQGYEPQAGGGGGGTATPSSCKDQDTDGWNSCVDCDDSDPAVHPGAVEIENQKDDNCDGKIDIRIAGKDSDGDGVPYPADCNDEELLVNPNVAEVADNKVDDNCSGEIDEKSCDNEVTDSSASAFAKAMEVCTGLLKADFPFGDVSSRGIRGRFGDNLTPIAGGKMVMLSTGRAKDTADDPAYSPQLSEDEAEFGTNNSPPIYSPARCAAQNVEPEAKDLSELSVTLQVPAAAKGLAFSFTFLSAEYPEFVCTEYNDRFVTVLESSALDPAKLPPQQCKTDGPRPRCNISYDSKGEPMTVNNGFFDICNSADVRDGTGGFRPHMCPQSVSLLENTGYETVDAENPWGMGGATRWLTTRAPVTPGEIITLTFAVFDEGDHLLDTAVLLDNFRWVTEAAEVPTTSEIN